MPGKSRDAIDVLEIETDEVAVAPNLTPVAQPDTYWVTAGDGLVVPMPGILANDEDDGDFLIPVLVAGFSHGEGGFDLLGGLSYTPWTGFAGIDTLTYRAFDGELYSDPVAVTVEVRRIEVTGTAGNDRLRGTADAELFRPMGGAMDLIWLGGGMDVVAVGDIASNGQRDQVRIRDFGPDDVLDLGGARIARVSENNGWLRLVLEGDRDLIALWGVSFEDLVIA